MGREVKRVPVDFDWPLDKVWQGYLMPTQLHVPNCPDCKGDGVTPARKWVDDIARLLLMLDDDLDAQAKGQPLHPYLPTMRYSGRSERPSADIREIGTGLAGRTAGGFFGHDAIDGWRATDAVIRAAGLDPEAWGMCPTCNGTGGVEAYPGQRDSAEAWERTEPPVGEGWQVWETVSEGSPITPAFPTAEALVGHLTRVGTAWDQRRGEGGWRREAAESFVGTGWAPSLVTQNGEVLVGGRDVDRMDGGAA